jgi:hypothetical protein
MRCEANEVCSSGSIDVTSQNRRRASATWYFFQPPAGQRHVEISVVGVSRRRHITRSVESSGASAFALDIAQMHCYFRQNLLWSLAWPSKCRIRMFQCLVHVAYTWQLANRRRNTFDQRHRMYRPQRIFELLYCRDKDRYPRHRPWGASASGCSISPSEIGTGDPSPAREERDRARRLRAVSPCYVVRFGKQCSGFRSATALYCAQSLDDCSSAEPLL